MEFQGRVIPIAIEDEVKESYLRFKASTSPGIVRNE